MAEQMRTDTWLGSSFQPLQLLPSDPQKSTGFPRSGGER